MEELELMENKSYAFMAKKFPNVRFKRNQPFSSHKTGFSSRPFIKKKFSGNKFNKSSGSFNKGRRVGTVDWSKVRCFKCNDLGHMANECKSTKKDQAYLALEAKYEALLKETNSKKKGESQAYIAEGKCWDITDEDEDDAEFCNLALMVNQEASSSSQVPTLTTKNMTVDQYKATVEKLSVEMFHLHTSLTASNEELTKVNAKCDMLVNKNAELETLACQANNLREEVEYLKNKLLCASQIETALREELAQNEFKMKAFKNASNIVKSLSENTMKNNVAIGLDYSVLEKKKDAYVNVPEAKPVNKDAPPILKNVVNPLFKKTSAITDEDSLLIKQMLCDEDEALAKEQKTSAVPKSTKSKAKSNGKNVGPVFVKLIIDKNTLVNDCQETVISTTKKKKQNRNWKIGVNKRNEYAYVHNAPRKKCEICFSSNHLTHVCKKFVNANSYKIVSCDVPDALKTNGLCDRFDCIHCNMNVMNKCFILRKHFMNASIDTSIHTTPSSKAPNVRTIKDSSVVTKGPNTAWVPKGK